MKFVFQRKAQFQVDLRKNRNGVGVLIILYFKNDADDDTCDMLHFITLEDLRLLRVRILIAFSIFVLFIK